MYKIQKNIPLPQGGRVGQARASNKWGFLRNMKVGDSFLMTTGPTNTEALRARYHITQLCKTHGFKKAKFIIKCLSKEQSEYRCWRVK